MDGNIDDVLTRLAEVPGDTPIDMLNLMRLVPETGKASFAAYSKAVAPLIGKAGGKQLYSGRYNKALMGDGDWQVVAIVRYPSKQAFLDMVNSEAYQAIYHHRRDAIEAAELHAVLPFTR